jgi:hypothetical protein
MLHVAPLSAAVANEAAAWAAALRGAMRDADWPGMQVCGVGAPTCPLRVGLH